MIADELRTVLWPKASDGDDASWQARVEVWNDPAPWSVARTPAPTSTGCAAPTTPPRSSGDCLRKRKLVPLERAIQLMTEAPAELFGLHDRGRIAEGMCADLFVFDPETVGSEPATLVHDLPGGSPRLIADAIGVVRVLVNGVETVADGKPTGNLPGALLRSGRDTVTVDPSRHGLSGRSAGRSDVGPPRRPVRSARRRPRTYTADEASDSPRRPPYATTVATGRRGPQGSVGETTSREGDPPWERRSPRTRRSCSSGASGWRPATAPTTSSIPPPSRWWARPPTHPSMTPTPPRRRPRRPFRRGPPPRWRSGWPC